MFNQLRIYTLEGLPPEVKAEKPLKTKKLKPEHRKFVGGALILAGAVLLVIVGTLIFNRLIQPLKIAKILPAENTIAAAEFDIDLKSSQVKKFFNLTKNYEVFKQENLINSIDNAFGINFEDDIEPWMGRRMSAALRGFRFECRQRPGAAAGIRSGARAAATGPRDRRRRVRRECRCPAGRRSWC